MEINLIVMISNIVNGIARMNQMYLDITNVIVSHYTDNGVETEIETKCIHRLFFSR